MENKGCVYFFRHIGLKPVKIGYSNNISPIERFNQFKTYAPYGSEIIGFVISDSAKKLESRLHKKFTSKRLVGEWFDITEEEVNNEIDFYSNIQDVNDRNNFQIQWAMKLNEPKVIELVAANENSTINNKIKKILQVNPLINKTEIAKMVGISRQTVHRYIRNGLQ